MTDVFALRTELDAARLARDSALADLDDRQVRLQRTLRWVERGAPGGAPHGHTPESVRRDAERELAELQQRVSALTGELQAVRQRLRRHLDRERPLFGSRSGPPVALLPVRLETRFTGVRDLKIRVYPDDIHVDALDVALTPDEVKAGRAYWRNPDDDAWRALLDRMRPQRAAWVAHATRRGSTPKTRAPGVRRMPRASTLPSRWRFIGVLGGRTVLDKVGRPIPTPVPLGLLESDERREDRDDRLDPAAWLVEFAAAERIGMATTARLPVGVDGLDQLFVVGVQDSPPALAAQRLQGTLRAHAFTAGLAFLAPGTPTNNTPESRSDWSSRTTPRRPRPRPPELREGSDAAVLAVALGLTAAETLAYCPGAARDTITPARAMGMLSWAGLTRQLVSAASFRMDLGEGFEDRDPAVFTPVRRHLVGHVRSRGVLPTFRVGRQPYGVLPVSSLDEWEPTSEDDPDALLLPWLLRLRHHWRAALVPGWIPRASDGRPADRTSVEALIRLPVAEDLMIRRIRNSDESRDLFDAQSLRAPGPVLSVGGIGYDNALRWQGPTEVTSTASWQGDSALPDRGLVGQRLCPDPERDKQVLGRSAEKYADALALLDRSLTPARYAEKWLRRAGSEAPLSRDVTIFERFLPGQDFVLSLLNLANWEDYPTGAGGPDGPAPDDLASALQLPRAMDTLAGESLKPRPRRSLITFLRREGLRHRDRCEDVLAWVSGLAEVPAEDLLPLTFEALDVLSHRWDAWATSLPSARLGRIRRVEERTEVRIGGYGWVENLRRTDPPDPSGPPGAGEGSRPRPATGDGYIHAPSLHHAATAAVLRSGFLGHDGDTTLAVDLSSRRVRTARWLLAGVRRGQELGSLLGYRFERALHDAHLDDLVADFRRELPVLTVPADAGQGADPTWERSHEAIAARNVVDGLRLARRPDLIEQATAGLLPGPAEALRRAGRDLVDALDAVGDLVLAESVHQILGGSPMRAGTAADTLGRGEQVPDRFDVATTPRRGRVITHRLVTVLPARPRRVNGWGRDAFSELDVRLDAWVGQLLGPAAGWRLTAVVDGDQVDTTAAALGFGALGMLLVSDDRRGRLDARLRDLAGRPRGDVELTAGWRELAAVCAAVRTVLAGTQPWQPEPTSEAPRARADLDELRTRVAAFAGRLADPEVRRLLELPSPDRVAALVERPVSGRGWLGQVTAALDELLGVALPVAPLLRGTTLPDPQPRVSAADVADWLRRCGAVRPSLRAWHDLVAFGDARAGVSTDLVATQSPAGGAWIAGTFAPAERPPAREHWVRHAPAGRPTGAFAGFVVDSWADVLPGSDALAATKRGRGAVPVESELTGVSFHFDRPDARAPQAVLLAVPPNRERGWTADSLALVVRDTLELAKLRAVDLADLPLLDDLLPGARVGPLDHAGTVPFDLWNTLVED